MNPKRLVLLMIGSLLLSSGAFSRIDAHRAALGLQGGANFGTALIEPDDFSPSFMTGPIAGIRGDWRLVEPWYIDLAVNWERNGVTVDVAGIESDVVFDYIEVPLRIKWLWLLDGMPVVPYAMAGIDVGFILEAAFEDEDAGDDFSSFDFGADVGLGINWDLTSQIRLFAQGRYTPWFLDITEDDVVGLDSWRNQDIKVMGGFMWLFGSERM